MKRNIHAVAVSSLREKNGIKERYAGVKKDEEGFFSNKIEWDWYPENSIENTSKLLQKTNEYLSNSNEQILSFSPNKGPMARRQKKKKSKTAQSTTKNDETPNLRHIQMMEGDLLYSINTENPHLDPNSKIHLKLSPNNDNNINKKITKILSCNLNHDTGQMTWKVKIEENNRTIEISHAELVIKNRDLFLEYCKANLVQNEVESTI